MFEFAPPQVNLRNNISLMATTQWQKKMEIPGRVLFSEGNGELAQLQITTASSHAEVYLHGAHITHFQKAKEPPVLFMSQLSHFSEGQPIRGGIPIIFPWFGARQGEAAHGFARTRAWELREVTSLPSGEVSLRLSLPDSPSAAPFEKFSADYSITIGQTLAAQLTVANLSSDHDFTFENCLHTYFAVGDVHAISVSGLKGVDYLDQTQNFVRKTEQDEHIKISRETDRIYLYTTGAVEIHDSSLQRRIRIEKSGSLSTVVWNPWVDKAERMPDFGDDEFRKMICVESGNVAENRIILPPGKSAALKVEISTLPL
jgi:D-hexose-6-phosphate mutarotase